MNPVCNRPPNAEHLQHATKAASLVVHGSGTHAFTHARELVLVNVFLGDVTDQAIAEPVEDWLYALLITGYAFWRQVLLRGQPFLSSHFEQGHPDTLGYSVVGHLQFTATAPFRGLRNRLGPRVS